MGQRKTKKLVGAVTGGGSIWQFVVGNVRIASAASAGAAVGRRRAEPVETIEERLERKGAIADRGPVSVRSLGQMTREERHKLLYGE